MNIRFYLILILSVIMTSFAFDPASAQNLLWEKKYMGLDTLPSTTYWARVRPAQLTELPDSTYLYLGWGQAQVGPGRFGYQDFKKLDKNGEIIWSRYIYPDTMTNVNPGLDFWSFQVMENGNNLLIGKQAMDSPNIQLFYVLTLDAEGQKISDTVYYGDVIFTPWCSVKGPGGIAVGGYVHGGLSQYAYAVKIGL